MVVSHDSDVQVRFIEYQFMIESVKLRVLR